MKKVLVLSFIISFALFLGCKGKVNDKAYLPEAKNDKVYTEVGTGEDYIIDIPSDDYLYEKVHTNGATEEKWVHIKSDGAQIKVITYVNSDELSARGKFLKDNEDYIFEDLTGYSLCGQKNNGDTLWFNLYNMGETVYIVSWQYPKNAGEDLQNELANIAGTFFPVQ